MKKQRRTFICGMSRSGTTWLGCCLNMHPEVAVFGETLYWGRCYIEPNSDALYGDRELDELIHFQKDLNRAFRGQSDGSLKSVDEGHWHQIVTSLRSLSPASPSAIFDSICSQIAKAEGKNMVIEKTPHHLNHVSRIERFYPDSHFIIMVRDPYSFMLSYKNQGLQRSADHRYHMSRYFHPIGCALVWKGYARQATKVEQQLGDRSLLIRFEKLKLDGNAVWQKVLLFLDVTPHSLPIIEDKNSSFSRHERPDLKPIDVFWMNLIAGNAIDGLGYTRRESGFPLLAIIVSLCSFIPCSIRVLKDISKRCSGGIISYILNWVKVGRS